MATSLSDNLVTQSGKYLEEVFSLNNWKPGHVDRPRILKW